MENSRGMGQLSRDYETLSAAAGPDRPKQRDTILNRLMDIQQRLEETEKYLIQCANFVHGPVPQPGSSERIDAGGPPNLAAVTINVTNLSLRLLEMARSITENIG